MKAILRRRVPLTHETRLRRQSAKHARNERLRMALKAVMLAEDPMCRRCRRRRAVDLHERRKRSRGGRIDRSNCVLLCRHPCHDLTESEPLEMGREGWLVGSTDDPGDVPVLVMGERLLLLADGTTARYHGPTTGDAA